jgi:excisionase family DNA binding protein
MRTEKRLFSIRESGERLGISRSLVRKLIRTGTLRAVRINRRVLIAAEAVDRLELRGCSETGNFSVSNSKR